MMPFSKNTPVDPARARAKSWFETPEGIETAAAFEEGYNRLPRRLFLESALVLAGLDKTRVLNHACGTGVSVLDSTSRLAECGSMDLVQPFPAISEWMRRRRMGQVGYVPEETFSRIQASVPEAKCTFDIVLSYSALRLFDDPARAIADLVRQLAPGGMAYFLDLCGDLEDSAQMQLAERIEDDKMRRFFQEQIDAAWRLDDIRRFLSQSGIENFRLSQGGLAGFPTESPEALNLVNANDRIPETLFSMRDSGFRTRAASDAVFHLFVYANEGKGHA